MRCEMRWIRENLEDLLDIGKTIAVAVILGYCLYAFGIIVR